MYLLSIQKTLLIYKSETDPSVEREEAIQLENLKITFVKKALSK